MITALMLGIVVVLAVNAVTLGVLVQAIRKRRVWERTSQEWAAEGQIIMSNMVALSTEHAQLTGYIHKSVHDTRDALQTIITNHATRHELMMAKLDEMHRLLQEALAKESSRGTTAD